MPTSAAKFITFKPMHTDPESNRLVQKVQKSKSVFRKIYHNICHARAKCKQKEMKIQRRGWSFSSTVRQFSGFVKIMPVDKAIKEFA